MVPAIPALPNRFVLTLTIFLCLNISGLAAESKKEEAASIAPGQAAADVGQVADHSVMGASNLFGPSPGSKRGATAAGGSLADLPTTSLDLVLMGIVDGGSGDRRAVIMSKNDRVQRLYQVGDLVAGAQIRRILWGKVVLQADSGEEVLDMSEAASYRARETAAPVAAPAPRAAVAPQAEDHASADSWKNDDRLIPERVRLVLPDQERTAGESGAEGGAEMAE